MASIRPFRISDVFEFGNVNLDITTETFNTNFYGKYLARWPEYCISIYNCTGIMQGWHLGKIEGDRNHNEVKNWHGHVSGVTVEPNSRRQGLARLFMDYIENLTEKDQGYYVDLFVRQSNTTAIKLYEAFGYKVYQTVHDYYSSQDQNKSENAYDMRKSMQRDPSRLLMQPTHKTIEPYQLEFH